MKNATYGRILESSWQSSRTLLLKPFSWRRWLKLMFIAFVGAQLMAGSSVKDVFDLTGWLISGKDAETAVDQAAQGKDLVPAQDHSGNPVLLLKGYAADFWMEHHNDPLFWVLAGSGTALGIFLILLMLWVSARFQFIWLHSLMTGDVAVKKPFREYRREGQSLFAFTMIFNCIVLGLMVLAAAVIFLSFAAVGSSVKGSLSGWPWPSVAAAGVVVLLIVLLFLGVTVLMFYVHHLVVPVMAMERVGIRLAWAKFRHLFSAHFEDLLVMPLVFLGLSIVAGISSLFGVLIIVFFCFLTAGVAGGLLYLLFYSLLSVEYMGQVTLVVLGTAWLICGIIAIAASLVPYAVFLRYFTLHFLASLEPAYQWNAVQPGTVLSESSDRCPGGLDAMRKGV